MNADYPIKIFKAFNSNEDSLKLLEDLSKSLTDIFNFFEPGFFKGKFCIVNNIESSLILPEKDSTMITFSKEMLLNQSNDFVIQLVDGNLYLWDAHNNDDIVEKKNLLIYFFESNREYFIANEEVIEITEQPFGSRFSNEFWELNKFLQKYAFSSIRKSSCPIFDDSWFDDNRIFFKGGDKDIPESYMQKSLKNFINNFRIFKGEFSPFEEEREHNLGASRPIDLLIRWEKSNRIALIEIKWLGKSKKDNGKITSTYNNARANEGYKQLKEYYELAKKDYPTKIINCYLVVIDGRRWQTNENTSSISLKNGMHYTSVELEINDELQYWKTYQNFEIPIRMFVEPICEI